MDVVLAQRRGEYQQIKGKGVKGQSQQQAGFHTKPNGA
jgi:hypothetical protein